MKASELMIGDWVLYGRRYAIVKRLEYARCDILVEINSRHDDIVTETYDNIEPIPLSAEILEKNGFTKSNIFIEWKYEEEGIYILWKPFPFLKIEAENVQLNLSGCEYVHELQHALRLCGIDKEIVL